MMALPLENQNSTRFENEEQEFQVPKQSKQSLSQEEQNNSDDSTRGFKILNAMAVNVLINRAADIMRKGGKENLEKGANLIERMAYSGDMNAQHNLGTCYLYGLGKEKSLKDAAKWYSMALSQGNPMSKECLEQTIREIDRSKNTLDCILF